MAGTNSRPKKIRIAGSSTSWIASTMATAIPAEASTQRRIIGIDTSGGALASRGSNARAMPVSATMGTLVTEIATA